MKRGFFCLFFVLIAAIVTSSSTASNPSLRNLAYERVSPVPAKHFLYPYYFYLPPELKTEEALSQTHTLLVIPNNTGKVSDDFYVHEADARRRMEQVPELASALKVAVLMPVFPRPASDDWKIYTQALDRDSLTTSKSAYRRFDRQLIAMIDDARTRLDREYGLRFDKRVFLNGFSAQAMFANRFTFLHPERVKAAAIGSPGGWPIVPVEKYNHQALRYPIGVSDFRQVAGEPLNMNVLRQVPLLIFMGDKDDNDAVPYGDAYENQDRAVIVPLFGETPLQRWESARAFYALAGMNAEFKLYPGAGHEIVPEMRDDVRVFFEEHMN
jgi:predicted esterase